MDLVKVIDWTPALADEALLRHVDVEEVEGVVDGLDLAHLYEPVLVLLMLLLCCCPGVVDVVVVDVVVFTLWMLLF